MSVDSRQYTTQTEKKKKKSNAFSLQRPSSLCFKARLYTLNVNEASEQAANIRIFCLAVYAKKVDSKSVAVHSEHTA